MVEHTPENDKAGLIVQLDTARGQIARSLGNLRRDADLGSHIKHSFSTHKAAWIGSAGIAGWLLSRLPARRKKVIVHRESGETAKEIAGAGIAIAILKMLFTLFRPLIVGFASKKIADIAKKSDRWQK